MPLEEFVPKIDNRRYDDILTEARTRIARYTPEWTPVWTDVNDSDPGITLVQLFAWLSEMLLYRLGRVPENNYLKFLQLLGIELTPAQSARVEITFPVLPNFPEPYVIVPLRTQVSAEGVGGAPPTIFETERALVALRARLDKVQVFDGYAHQDVSAANEEFGQGFAPFGPEAGLDSALLLGFAYVGPFPQVELNLAVWVAEADSGPVFSECSLPESASYPSARLAWEYWNGREWRSLSLLKDETQALTRSGHIYLKTPLQGEMQPAAIGAVNEPRYWIRGRLVSSAYERPPHLLGLRTNTLAAVQAETVRDEVLGGSDGRPNQIFTLTNRPVLADTLTLEVDEGDGFQPWTRVDDFYSSQPADRHYLLNRTSGEVRFGDGFHGDIPAGNIANPGGNIVAREYRFGGGKQGNVAAGRLRTLVTPIQGVDENGVTNLQPALGGRDEETLEEAKRRAPQTLKNKCRAVTGEDFEALAKQAANIRRAKALPLFHPAFPEVKVPGVVTVIVVPDSEAPNPLPSEGTLRTVCAYLNQRRLLTTELYVIAPVYRQVRIEAEVIAANNADLGEVQTGIERSLLDYFHPLKGGEDGQGWPFGGNIFYSRVYQRVFTIPGVARIESLAIWLDGEVTPECKDVTIPDEQLLYSLEHDIQVNYSFEE
jgi:predicted phage baseplate assembly protein